MNIFLSLLIALSGIADGLVLVNDGLSNLINGLAGRSWILDNLIALPIYNPLAGAVVLCSCFLLVWTGTGEEAVMVRKRRILLITLIACFLAVAATNAVSQRVFQPRPFVLSQKTFHLEGDQLVDGRRLNYRTPLDNESQKTFNSLKKGDLARIDLDSFPSPQAGLYMTLAIGILLASRKIGLFALCWTFFFTLGSRIVTGLNSPLDIVVGSIIGAGILLFLQFALNKFGRRLLEPFANWTVNHQAFATAIIFFFLFDAVSMFANLQHLLDAAIEIGKHLIRG